MTKIRRRSKVIDPIKSLTLEQLAELTQLARDNGLNWSTKHVKHAALIEPFRSELKEHYFREQLRLCCYCCIELHKHKGTYDAEHILDKAEYPEYMFAANNIAACCKLCNQFKSNNAITQNGARLEHLSLESCDYTIVHPHLDEWAEHLRYDSIGRITAKIDSRKGPETIKICGIQSLNASRLADAISIDEMKEAENALRKFLTVDDIEHKKKTLKVLEELARISEMPEAIIILTALRRDIDQPTSTEAAELNTKAQQSGHNMTAPAHAQQQLLYATVNFDNEN